MASTVSESWHPSQQGEMKKPSDIDLLLIGKTGNGKSATGNSILQRKVFRSMSSTSSVTKHVHYEVSDFDGQIIKVVDGPGVGDTRLNNEAAMNLILSAMEYAIAANPRGYHAFLLVVRFGGRFTVEDQDTIVFLKNVFGEDFVRNFCILVLTHGDNFENGNNESGVNFKDWCSQQEGVFAELLTECCNRIVLFDNTTKDESKRRAQIKDLLKIVDTLGRKGHRYTDKTFAKAQDARQRIMVEAKKPLIREETMNETSLIIQKVQQIQLKNDLYQNIEALEILQVRAYELLQKISSEDRGTGALQDLCEIVKSLQKTISDETDYCIKTLDEKVRIRRQEEQNRKFLEKELQKQKEELEKRLTEERLKEEEKMKQRLEQEIMKREAEEKARKEKEREEETERWKEKMKQYKERLKAEERRKQEEWRRKDEEERRRAEEEQKMRLMAEEMKREDHRRKEELEKLREEQRRREQEEMKKELEKKIKRFEAEEEWRREKKLEEEREQWRVQMEQYRRRFEEEEIRKQKEEQRRREDEERRQLKEKQEWRRRKDDERRKIEREKYERKLQEDLEEEQKKQNAKTEELQRNYEAEKTKNDQSIVSKIFGFIKGFLMKVAGCAIKAVAL